MKPRIYSSNILLLLFLLTPCFGQSPEASPSEDEFAEALSENPRRAYLGLRHSVEPIPGEEDRFKFVVLGVEPGGAAGRAGVEAGDEIVEIDGEPLVFEDPIMAGFYFDPLTPGQKVELRILRGEEVKSLTVQATELPPEMIHALAEARRAMRPNLALQTLEILGRGEGTELEISRLETGAFVVRTVEPTNLAPFRFDLVAEFFGRRSFSPKLDELAPGEARVFVIRYDEAQKTYYLDDVPDR